MTKKIAAGGLIIALLLALLAFPAAAHNPDFTQADNVDDLIAQAEHMQYEVRFGNEPVGGNGVINCGYTSTTIREIFINTSNACTASAGVTLSHELGHVVHTEPSWNALDNASFQEAKDLSTTPYFSGWCLSSTGSFIDYLNSVCEVYGGAASLANGYPHRRGHEGQAIEINNAMKLNVIGDFMVQLNPRYSCQVALSYRMWLGRQVDEPGFNYWVSKGWESNWSVNSIVRLGIWPSPEFQGSPGDVGPFWNISWKMISNAYGRPPLNWSEQDFWRDRISAVGKRSAWEEILNLTDALNVGPCGTNASSYSYLNSQQI